MPGSASAPRSLARSLLFCLEKKERGEDEARSKVLQGSFTFSTDGRRTIDDDREGN